MLKAMILLVQILDGSDEEYCEHWADEMPIQKVDVDNVKDTRYVLLLWISLCLYIGGNFCEDYSKLFYFIRMGRGKGKSNKKVDN